MKPPAVVQIVGAVVACQEGAKDTWREVASWAAGQLVGKFGPAVQVEYFDLFDAACPSLPTGAQLPVVLVNGDLVSNGGKISVPLIRRKIESILEAQTV